MNIRGLLRAIDEAVFPSNIYCMICGALIDKSRPYSLCDECVGKLHWINESIQEDGSVQRTCAKCGKALPASYRGARCYDCMSTEHFFERGFSCLTYGLHERELMMDLKYNGKSYIATKMGEAMFDRMAAEIVAGALSVDVVVPVPVSEERLRKRGYNQAGIMAKAFVRTWADTYGEDEACAPAPKCCTNALRRIKNTQMLRSLNPAERVMAMQGAFESTSAGRLAIQGKNVLLIDDIYTTGATADACSRTLLESGANKVYLLTLASGGNRKPIL